MKGRLKQLFLVGCWTLAIYWGWNFKLSRQNDDVSAKHDSLFHMHQPLHDGGKVTMKGQFHFELISQADGTHRLWLSNAFRQEMDPAGFDGELTVASLDGEAHQSSFERVGNTNELRAKTGPLRGQVWLTIAGQLGDIAKFDGVKLFWDYDLTSLGARPRLGLDPMVPNSLDNPLTSEKVEVGRDLFFDPTLSAAGDVSCATCHRPDYAFAESRPTTTGGGRRNTPTVLNVAYQQQFFWDGRSDSLDSQAIEPILARAEMGNASEAEVVDRLKRRYGDRIEEAFGEPISLATIAKALACFERTLLSGDADFDRYEAGEREAINKAAQHGRTLFFGKAACGNCHIPPLFLDYSFHNLGVGWQDSDSGDLGRYEVTNDPDDRGAFKTPTLRDISRTAPYMHDGSFSSLREVLQFYNRGGNKNPALDPLIKPLGLTSAEIDDLIEFLETLNGRYTVPPSTTGPTPKDR